MARQRNQVAMKFAKIVKHCRIDKPRHFKLADHDPAESFGLSTRLRVRYALGGSVIDPATPSTSQLDGGLLGHVESRAKPL